MCIFGASPDRVVSRWCAAASASAAAAVSAAARVSLDGRGAPRPPVSAVRALPETSATLYPQFVNGEKATVKCVQIFSGKNTKRSAQTSQRFAPLAELMDKPTLQKKYLKVKTKLVVPSGVSNEESGTFGGIHRQFFYAYPACVFFFFNFFSLKDPGRCCCASRR